MLKKWHVIIFLLTGVGLKAQAQQLDSIYFNLYTDSLKKGTYNYINVEGKFKDGRYQPLGDKELKFTASRGVFHGNSLYVDSSITDDKIRVKVSVIGNPRLTREIDIYIKRYEAQESLPTMEEVLNGKKPQRSKKIKKKS
jgi:hypothetical protein